MAINWEKIGNRWRDVSWIYRSMRAQAEDIKGTFVSAGNPTIHSMLGLREEWTEELGDTDEGQRTLSILNSYAASIQATALSQSLAARSLGDALLQDYIASQLEMGDPAANGQAVLDHMDADMYDGSENVVENTVSVTDPTAHTDNIGDGTLYIYSKRKDFGHGSDTTIIDVENSHNGNIDMECTSADENKPGEESWSVKVKHTKIGVSSPNAARFTVVGDDTGSRQITSKTRNLLSDSSFEGELASGSGGWSHTGNFAISSSAAFRGDLSLFASSGLIASAAQLLGDNTEVTSLGDATATLNGAANILPDTLYLYEGRFRPKTGAMTAGTIVALLEATSGDQTLQTITALNAGWNQKHELIRTPPNLSDDAVFKVHVNGADASGIYIDSQRLFRLSEHATLLWAVTQGETDFITGDRFEDGSLTNNENGKFQTVRRDLGYTGQFPSGTTATDDFNEYESEVGDMFSEKVTGVDLKDGGTTSYEINLYQTAGEYCRVHTVTVFCTTASSLSGDAKIKIGHTLGGEEILAETTLASLDGVGDSFVITSANLNPNATPGNDVLYVQVSSADSGTSGTATVVVEGVIV